MGGLQEAGHPAQLALLLCVQGSPDWGVSLPEPLALPWAPASATSPTPQVWRQEVQPLVGWGGPRGRSP